MIELSPTPPILFLTAGNLVKIESGGLVVVGSHNQITFALTKSEAVATSHHLHLLSQIWTLLINNNCRHFDSDIAIRPYNQLIFCTDRTDLVAEIQVFQGDTCLILSKRSFRHTNKLLVLDVEKAALENFFNMNFPLGCAKLPPIGAERAAIAAATAAYVQTEKNH